MNNKLTMTWGVVPGRQVRDVTKRFHRRRPSTEAERAVAKALGVKVAEARRQLRYAQEYQAGRTTSSKEQDWLELAAQRHERMARAEAKQSREEVARATRVAQHTER